MRAGFATDFLGWANEYTTHGWRGIFTSFDANNLTHVHHAINYLLFVLFGNNPFLWALVYIVLHTGIAVLWLDLGLKIGKHYKLKNAELIAISGSFLFLISPYQFEVLTWKVCLHYLLVHLFCVLIFKVLISNQIQSFVWMQGKIVLLFVAALFSIELSFAIPFMVLAFLLFLKHWKDEKRLIVSTSILLFFLLGLYLCFNRIFLGDWVGHYGSDTHLNFDLRMIIIHFMDYLFQFIFLLDYWPIAMRIDVYQWVADNYMSISAILSFFVLLGTRFKKYSILLYALLFAFALLPILNLYFYTTTPIVNDRYGYLASAPFYLGLSSLVVLCFKRFGKLVLLGLIGLHLYFAVCNSVHGYQAGKVLYSMSKNISSYNDERQIVLLTLPDNYNGFHLFREIGAPQGLSLKESYEWIYGHPFNAELIAPAQFNMQHVSDEFTVQKTGPLHYSIVVDQPGTWFWRNGIGAMNESNKYFESQFFNGYYHLELDEKLRDATVLKTNGLEFIELSR